MGKLNKNCKGRLETIKEELENLCKMIADFITSATKNNYTQKEVEEFLEKIYEKRCNFRKELLECKAIIKAKKEILMEEADILSKFDIKFRLEKAYPEVYLLTKLFEKCEKEFKEVVNAMKLIKSMYKINIITSEMIEKLNEDYLYTERL